MTRLMSIPLPQPDRRTLMKLSISAAACFTVSRTVPFRTGEGTWVLSRDDA